MGVVRYLCITIFLVFLAVSSSNAGNNVTEGCNYKGREGSGGDCLCISGVGGEHCDTELSCGPTVLQPSQTNTDQSYPRLDQEFHPINFTANSLTASIIGPVVANRSYTDVKFVGSNPSVAACSLGTAGSFWTLSADNDSCADRMFLNMPWSAHHDCGFALLTTNEIETPDLVWQFKATVLVSYVDILGTIGEDDAVATVERRSSAAFHMYVLFEKFVRVNIEEVVVYSEVNLTVAITLVDYNPDTMKLTIQLTTIVLWPNQIRSDPDHLPIVTVPEGLDYDNTSLIITSGGCPLNSVTDDPCMQVIEFKIDFNRTHGCDFNGDYTLNSTITTCRNDGEGQSDYDVCTWKFFETHFWISQSFICGVAEVNPTVSGKLVAYEDDAMTDVSTNFILGYRGYFDVLLTSENDLNLTFTDIWAVPEGIESDPTTTPVYFLQNSEVVTTVAGNPNPLYDASEIQSIVDLHVSDVTLRTLPNNVKVYAPHFDLHFNGFIFRPEVGETRLYTIHAIGKIVYLGNEYLGKRELKTRVIDFVWKTEGANLRSQVDVNLAEAKEAIAPAHVGSSSSSSFPLLSAVLPVAGVALVAIVGAVVVAAIIIKKKKATAFTPFN